MIRPIIRIAAAILAVQLAANFARAVEPDEMLPDPVLESRARAISQELRCLVCQNQTIDDSHADLARDLRLIVRERLKAGDSDRQAIDFVVDRYGEFVLMKPRLETRTYLLWFGPGLILLLAAGFIIRGYRRRQRDMTAEAPLTPSERARLDNILGGGESS